MTRPLVLLDAAGTLIHKPGIVSAFVNTLADSGILVEAADVAVRHKLLSEAIIFPDKTDRSFYLRFNSRLFEMLGVVPTGQLVDDVYTACGDLRWELAPGAEKLLSSASCAFGIVSNFGSRLRAVLKDLTDSRLDPVVISAEVGVRKPNPRIFMLAIEAAGQPQRVIAVGDSVRLDVGPAITAGCETVLVDPYDIYRAHPYQRVRGLDELETVLSS